MDALTKPGPRRGRVSRAHPVATLLVVVCALFAGCSETAGDQGLDSRSTESPSLTQTLPSSSSALPVSQKGVYSGTHFGGNDEVRKRSLTDLEKEVGKQFTLDHVYHKWSETFPSAYDRWTIGQGRTLFLNWTSREAGGKNPAQWSDISKGKYDELIDERAVSVKEIRVPVLLGFTHEPGQLIGDLPSSSGTAEEYVAAWRHVVNRFRLAGALNVSWVWTLTAFQFRKGDVEGLYPGNDVIDWVGVDGYVNIECPWMKVSWKSFGEVFDASVAFAKSKGKPVVVAEFNAGEDPKDSRRKGEWLVGIDSYLNTEPTIKALVSFNSLQPCGSIIGSSRSALDGYADLTNSSTFREYSPKATP